MNVDSAPRSRRPKRSAEEQINALQERAWNSDVKTRLVRVNTKLRANPTILQEVDKYIDMLVSRGGKAPAATPTPTKAKREEAKDHEGTPPPKLPACMAPPVDTLGLDSKDEAATDNGSMATASIAGEIADTAAVEGYSPAQWGDSSNWIPHCYTTFGGCSLNFLKPMLSAIEPIAFSALSLRGLIERGKREMSKISI